MPQHIVFHTMTLLTGLTSKSCHLRRVYLPRFAPFGEAPSEVGDFFEDGFGSEFIVAI
jgi:hypothetical protein